MLTFIINLITILHLLTVLWGIQHNGIFSDIYLEDRCQQTMSYDWHIFKQNALLNSEIICAGLFNQGKSFQNVIQWLVKYCCQIVESLKGLVKTVNQLTCLQV